MPHSKRTAPGGYCYHVLHPQFHMHFTPTSSSWLNLVERWFREITQQRIRRGVFTNVK